MGVFALRNVWCVRETEILVEQQPPQGVLVCDHAGLARNKFPYGRGTCPDCYLSLSTFMDRRLAFNKSLFSFDRGTCTDCYVSLSLSEGEGGACAFSLAPSPSLSLSPLSLAPFPSIALSLSLPRSLSLSLPLPLSPWHTLNSPTAGEHARIAMSVCRSAWASSSRRKRNPYSLNICMYICI